MQVKDACVLVANILARDFRPVLYNNHLEVLAALGTEALQQFGNLVGAVIDGYNDRIPHKLIIINYQLSIIN
jgi:hypothetical protein